MFSMWEAYHVQCIVRYLQCIAKQNRISEFALALQCKLSRHFGGVHLQVCYPNIYMKSDFLHGSEKIVAVHVGSIKDARS